VWLDARKTSPYAFYQYWINLPDADAASMIRIFTLKEKEEIDALVLEHQQAPHLRKLQKSLAEDITTRVHSRDALDKAMKASVILFGNSTASELESLDEETLLSVLEGVPKAILNKEVWDVSPTVTDLLSELTQGIIFPSKGEARKMILGGGVSLNKEKLTDPSQKATAKLLHGRFIVAQKGKKNYFLIEVK
jgi:tyrosyl-tRNA synthetase